MLAAGDGISHSMLLSAAIEGAVYMIYVNGGKKDLQSVRQIEGVCEKVHKGTVRVGF